MPAGIQHGDLLEHLAHDDFDMLVVDAHALEAVHFLDLVHEVAGQVLFTAGAQDVVQFGRTFGQRIAGFHEVARRPR